MPRRELGDEQRAGAGVDVELRIEGRRIDSLGAAVEATAASGANVSLRQPLALCTRIETGPSTCSTSSKSCAGASGSERSASMGCAAPPAAITELTVASGP